MNRIEIVGLFSAIQELMEAKQYESVERIVGKVLREAENRPISKKDFKKTKPEAENE